MNIKFNNNSKEILKKIADHTSVAQQIPLSKIFTLEFMTANTGCKTLSELFTKAQLDVNATDFSQNDISKIDKVVSDNTNFKNWNDMYGTAYGLYLKKEFS